MGMAFWQRGSDVKVLQCATFLGGDVLCNVSTFPGGDVKRGSRLWSVGLQRVLEGTKPKQAFSLTVDISGKARRSKSNQLAAGQKIG